jgi:hypothetical protein
MKMWHQKTFVEFRMAGRYIPGVAGINRNLFVNLECQSINGQRKDPDIFTTVYGIKDIKHTGNTFINVNIWDFPDLPSNFPGIPFDAKIANITKDAADTIIIGGTMARKNFNNANRNFRDLGKDTRIL